MSSLPRSLSTPHVAQRQPFLVPSGSQSDPPARARPRMRRHHTSLALTDLVARAGHQTPRTEDDPFSLGGFFPSPLAVRTPERSDAEWNWLHAQQDAFEAEERMLAGTEAEEEDDGSGPHVMFDRAQDVRTAETIMQEDKLGVLSLRSDMFSAPSEVRVKTSAADDRLLSPYCEDNPLDDDAVYQSLAALRKAHDSAVVVPALGFAELDGSGPLFCPVEDAAAGALAYEEDGSWSAVLSQGVGMILDYLAI